MRILVSNDDGVHAPGVRCLANALADAGHEVFVGAPDRERSATGHCLTLHKPLRADEVPELYNSQVKKAWKINGTPCDAAKLSMNMLLDIQTIDLVVFDYEERPAQKTVWPRHTPPQTVQDDEGRATTTH